MPKFEDTVARVDINSELGRHYDDVLLGLAYNIYFANASLGIYELIGTNATKINEKGVGRRFWAYLQTRMKYDAVLNICKIHEPPDPRFPLYSIPSITNELASQFGPNIHQIDELVEYKSELDLHTISYERLKLLRNKVIAHPEQVHRLGDEVKSGPSIEIMEKLINIGEKVSMVLRTNLLNVSSFIDVKEDARKAVAAAERNLEISLTQEP